MRSLPRKSICIKRMCPKPASWKLLMLWQVSIDILDSHDRLVLISWTPITGIWSVVSRVEWSKLHLTVKVNLLCGTNILWQVHADISWTPHTLSEATVRVLYIALWRLLAIKPASPTSTDSGSKLKLMLMDVYLTLKWLCYTCLWQSCLRVCICIRTSFVT